jgi:rSAM/selenodomain-associated transferase 1
VRHEQTCAIGVMAKAPVPGRSKTRLCPPLRAEQAAALSAAFLRDVTENIAAAARAVPILGLVAYAPVGSMSLFDGNVADGTEFVLADGVSDIRGEIPPDVTGFGRCLLHAIQAMLLRGFAAACVLNADSPTLPTKCLADAARALLTEGDRVVLGPAEDGGYYLLGVKAPHARLFADIAWSTDSVADATRARARELGLEIVELPVWYDVDDRISLARLLRGFSGQEPCGIVDPISGEPLSGNPFPARATEAALRRIGLFATTRLRATE